MAFPNKTTVDTDFTTLADLLVPGTYTPSELKAVFHNNWNGILVYLNAIKTVLESTTDADSGADNIGATAIAGLTGGTVQSLLESLNTLKATLASPTFTGTVVLPSTTSIGTVTSTEIGYLDNVTSSIQTQLNVKQALDATLTALAAFNTNGLIKQTAADTFTAVAAPTGAVVGDSDVQTLSNKTLTAPEFGTSGYIADANGNELIKFPATVVSAVNEVTIINTATLGKPSISATGGDINISLDLISKGAGTVQANSVDIVTTTETQTLTNKSISGGQISSAVANATNAALAANVTTNANLTGDITSVGNATAIASGVIVNADINASAAIDASKISNGLVSNAEFQYLDGVTSGIQTQINNVVLGQIPDNSLTNIKLATDIKVGSLATLTTTDKSSVVAAVNEHLADFTLQIPYAVTTGTANIYAISLPIPALVESMAVTVKINVASTGASTLNWDGKGAKGIKKPDGTDMTNLKLNGLYTFRYDGVNFIVQGEGGEYGTATQPDVKASKTLGTPDGVVQGTMPENGALGGTITNQGGTVNIPSGHTTGGVVDANISNLIAGNIKDNVNVGGVVGTFSELANGATAAQILATRSAAVNGAIVNGAMVDRAGDTAALAIATSVNTLRLRASDGFRDGVNDWVTRLENNWIPSNIKNTVSMFGKVGTYEGEPVNGQTEEIFLLGETISKNDPIFIQLTEQSKLANPAALPANTGYGVAFSSDGVYMAVAHLTTPYITIYKRSGDTFTKLANPATLPASTGNGVTFSPDGIYMAVAHDISPFVTIYKRSGDVFTKLANPAALPTGQGLGVAFSPDGIYMAVAHDTTPFVTIYKRSGDTFTKLANPATLPASTGNGVAFSPDGIYMAVAHFTTPFVTIYKRSGDVFTKLANPAALPTGQGLGVAFSPDGIYMAVAHDTTPFVTIYKRSGDTFTKLANPVTLPAGTGYSVAFSPGGGYMAVGSSITPFVTIYKRSGDASTKLANPAALPTGQGLGVAFSPDRVYMAVAHPNSPFVTIYKNIFEAFISDVGNWREADKVGYAKEAGLVAESKTMIITHR